MNIFCGTKEDQTDQEHNSTWCCFSVLIYVTEEGLENVADVSDAHEFIGWRTPIVFTADTPSGTYNQQQPFNSRLSRTTRVCRHQNSEKR